MPGIQTILHPTDFSENSRPAFRDGLRSGPGLPRDFARAPCHGALCLPAHARAAARSAPIRRIPGIGGAIALAPAVGPADSRGASVGEGDPAEEILRLTEAQRCDLVVMGTHGKTGLGRLLTGSVAEEVLRKAVCPVLVVRTPLRAMPDQETTANPGDIVDVRPLGSSLVSAHTRTLVRTGTVEVVRLIVRAGQQIPQHTSTRRARRALPGGTSGLDGPGKDPGARSREATASARWRAARVRGNRGCSPSC